MRKKIVKLENVLNVEDFGSKNWSLEAAVLLDGADQAAVSVGA